MLRKKIIGGLILVAAVFALAGCGAKDSAKNNSKKTDKQTPAVTENLPEATGKVDDTVNAIIDGAGSEKAQAIDDEGDAKAAVDDSQDVNNLTNAYDQNAL